MNKNYSPSHTSLSSGPGAWFCPLSSLSGVLVWLLNWTWWSCNMLHWQPAGKVWSLLQGTSNWYFSIRPSHYTSIISLIMHSSNNNLQTTSLTISGTRNIALKEPCWQFVIGFLIELMLVRRDIFPWWIQDSYTRWHSTQYSCIFHEGISSHISSASHKVM